MRTSLLKIFSSKLIFLEQSIAAIPCRFWISPSRFGESSRAEASSRIRIRPQRLTYPSIDSPDRMISGFPPACARLRLIGKKSFAYVLSGKYFNIKKRWIWFLALFKTRACGSAGCVRKRRCGFQFIRSDNIKIEWILIRIILSVVSHWG